MIDEIRELFAYNRWANDRVLGAVARLDADSFDRDLGSSYPSVRATLAHMLAAEWVWLERWNGRSPTQPPASWDLTTLDAIRDRWREVEENWTAFLATLGPVDLERRVAYRNTRGEPFRDRPVSILRHVVNHSTYHRGQIATLLRQLGAEPVGTDLIVYHREREAAGRA